MTTTIILNELHHVKNNITRLTGRIDGTTTEGREILTELAFIRSQLNDTTDHLKAF